MKMRRMKRRLKNNDNFLNNKSKRITIMNKKKTKRKKKVKMMKQKKIYQNKNKMKRKMLSHPNTTV